jgi:hypothetical protein
MKRTLRTFVVPAILLSFILMSCASTKLLSTWKDNTYSGNVKNVLIIVVAEKPGVRRVFERAYAFQLKSYGVDAVTSYSIIPADKMMEKDAILSKIEGMSVDSVLITSLVSRQTIIPENTRWYGHYSRAYGRSYAQDIVNVETALYDVKSEMLIWSALSETTMLTGDSTMREIPPFVEIILKNLSKDNLI